MVRDERSCKEAYICGVYKEDAVIHFEQKARATHPYNAHAVSERSDMAKWLASACCNLHILARALTPPGLSENSVASALHSPDYHTGMILILCSSDGGSGPL